MAKINEITHPRYTAFEDKWSLYRLTAGDAEDFLDEYLKQRPKETSADFNIRRDITYVPMFAKSALKQIQNSLRQRLIAVSRVGGSPNYNAAVNAKLGGVDRKSSSMNKFIGDDVLSELTTMGEVGIYVDASSAETETLADDANNIPYLYVYPVENIRAWKMDPLNPTRYVKLLLRDVVELTDPEFDLSTETQFRYRFYSVDDNGVITLTLYNQDGTQVDVLNQPSSEVYTLSITEIPFVKLKLNTSLLSDVARHQIALLNLASADMKYAWQGNTVFLAEQYNDRSIEEFFGADSDDPDSVTPGTSNQRKSNVKTIGSDYMVRVPKDLEFPKYISPDSAPLKISMEKQEQIKKEINEIINQTLKNISSGNSSAESKKVSERKEEDGLKAIGEELEYGEIKIAHFFALYEGSEDRAEIHYPENFQFKNDTDKRTEAKELSNLLSCTASVTGQKAIAKKLIKSLISDDVTELDLAKIFAEIDASPGAISDPTKLSELVDLNILSPETAAVQAGFSASEAVKAKLAAEERATAIAIAQSLGSQGARGNNDLSANPREEANAEKDALRMSGTNARK